LIKFVAQFIVLCISLLDDIKGTVAFCNATSVVLLLESTSIAPLVINTAEGGMLL
jgi:hypothetical protein